MAGGNYLVVVRDSMNCITKDTVSVTAPVRVVVSYTVKPVGCYNVPNGEIAVTATGGNAPYTYQWSNGATTATATNLSPGMYWYKVYDANGCFDGDTLIELDKPDTLLLNLGANRNICTGQTVHLDAFIPSAQPFTYAWTSSNGFTGNTARVAVKQEGDYYVVASNSRGCTMRDTISVTAINSSINTDFVVSTQAFVNESVHLVNISKPTTDSVKWILPSIGNTITLLQQNNNKCELRFADTGRYLITMRAYYPSGCIEDSTKTIHVIMRDGSIVQGNQANAFLKKFTVSPNPNNGTFTVGLEFSETTRAKLRLINTLDNFMVDQREAAGNKEYTLYYNLSSVIPGATYILVIDTPKGSFVYKVIIAR